MKLDWSIWRSRFPKWAASDDEPSDLNFGRWEKWTDFFYHPWLQLEHRLILCHAALMRKHSAAMKIDSSRATGRMGTELFGACLIEMFALCVRIWRWRRWMLQPPMVKFGKWKRRQIFREMSCRRRWSRLPLMRGIFGKIFFINTVRTYRERRQTAFRLTTNWQIKSHKRVSLSSPTVVVMMRATSRGWTSKVLAVASLTLCSFELLTGLNLALESAGCQDEEQCELIYISTVIFGKSFRN